MADHQYGALTRLVSLGNDMLRAPLSSESRLRDIRQAREAVAAELAKPAEGDRFVKSEAVFLADALIEMQRAINCGAERTRFAALAGMLLPFILEDQFDALRASIASRAATTEQTR